MYETSNCTSKPLANLLKDENTTYSLPHFANYDLFLYIFSILLFICFCLLCDFITHFCAFFGEYVQFHPVAGIVHSQISHCFGQFDFSQFRRYFLSNAFVTPPCDRWIAAIVSAPFTTSTKRVNSPVDMILYNTISVSSPSCFQNFAQMSQKKIRLLLC